MGEEDRRVALADRQSPSELRLGYASEDEPDDDRSDGKIIAAHHEAENAYDQQKNEIECRVVQAVDAERREDENAAIEQRLWDGQQPHPQSDQRKVQHQQHDIADIEARNQSPDQ